MFTLLDGVLYVCIEFLIMYLQWFAPSCAVGFSGVIFSLLSVEVALLPAGAQRR